MKINIDRTMIRASDMRLDVTVLNPGEKTRGHKDVVDAGPIV